MNCRRLICVMAITTIATTLSLFVAAAARAHSVAVEFTNTEEQCNDHPTTALKEEFGPGPASFDPGPFPADEEVKTSSTNLDPQNDCDETVLLGTNDWRVRLTNFTNPARTLTDCFIVADSGTTFTNWDGKIFGQLAKKFVDTWPHGTQQDFTVVDSSTGGPTFRSLGVSSGAADSNYSVVCKNSSIPALSNWGLVALGLLLLAVLAVTLHRSQSVGA